MCMHPLVNALCLYCFLGGDWSKNTADGEEMGVKVAHVTLRDLTAVRVAWVPNAN